MSNASRDLPDDLRERLAPVRTRLHGPRNSVLPIIGSGLSLPALPSWGDLLKEIAGRALSDTHRAELLDLLAQGWYLTAADGLEIDPGPQVIAQVIAKIYQRPVVPALPIYDLVADLPVTHLATTNYDPWLKDAVARKRGVAPRVYAPLDTGAFSDIAAGSPPLVLMLHGDADRPETCVLSQRAFRKLTHGSPAYRRGLAAMASQRSFLFIGHSLSDPDLVTVLEEWIEAFDGASTAPRHVWLGAGLKLHAQRRLQRMGVEPIVYGDDPHDHSMLPEILRYLAREPLPTGHTAPGTTKAAPGASSLSLPKIDMAARPLRPRVLIAGPRFGLDDALWAEICADPARAAVRIEENHHVALAQMSAIVRHEVIIDLSPWRAFARWSSLGFRDVEELARRELPAQARPDTLALFGFAPGDEQRYELADAGADALARLTQRLDQILTRDPALYRQITEAVRDDGLALAGFPDDGSKGAGIWAQPFWDAWSRDAAGLVSADARPAWLPAGARFERAAERMDVPLAEVTLADYLRALRVVAGQVRMVGELRYRAIEDVFADMEIVRGQRWHDLVREELNPESVPDRRAGQRQSDGAMPDQEEAPSQDEYDALLRRQEHLWTGQITRGERVQPERLTELGTRISLVGDAGTGKSTLLRWLAARHASAPDDGTVPVWLELSRLGWTRPLAVECAQHAVSAVNLPASSRVVAEIQEAIERKRAILFLDGLDEASRGVINALDTRLDKEIGTGCQVVISSRPVDDAFTDRSKNSYEDVRLWGLAASRDVRRFLVAYFGEEAWVDPLIRGLRLLPDGMRWSRTPVLLALAATHVAGGRTLPRDALQLYGEVIEHLLEKAAARCGLVPVGRGYKLSSEIAEARAALERFAVQLLWPESGEPRIRFERAELPAGRIRDLVVHSGLFSGAADTLRFTHLTLGEYLAARALVQKAIDNLGKERMRDRAFHHRLQTEVLPMAHALAGVDAISDAFADRDPDDGTYQALRLTLRSLAYGGDGSAVFARAQGQALIRSVVDALCPPSGRFARFEQDMARDAERAFWVAREFMPPGAWRAFEPLLYLPGRVGAEAQILAWPLGAEVERPAIFEAYVERAQIQRMAMALTRLLEKLPDRGVERLLEITRGEPHYGVRENAVHALAHDEHARSTLHGLLRDPYHYVRHAAVQALDETEQVVPAVRARLRDFEGGIRGIAKKAMIRDEQMPSIVRELLRDPVQTVREWPKAAINNNVQLRGTIHALLQDDDWRVRLAAVKALADDEQARPIVRELLHDEDWRVRTEAVSRLASNAQSHSIIHQLLDDPEPHVRIAAVQALSSNEDARPVIRPLLDDSSADVRWTAVNALSSDEEALPRLRELLHDDASHVRRSAVKALANDEQARSFIRQLLRDEDSQVQEAAVTALASDMEARPAIQQLLKDGHLRLPRRAARALASDATMRDYLMQNGDWWTQTTLIESLAGDEQDRPFLRKLLRDDRPHVKQYVVRALAKDKQMWPELRDMLHDPNSRVRVAAVTSLAGDAQAQPVIRELLHDESWWVREHVVKALANDEEARASLYPLLQDKHRNVRAAAVTTLANDSQARSIIRERLRDDDWSVRAAAVKALANDEPSKPAIRELLHDEHTWLRQATLTVLTSDEHAISFIRELLHHEDWSVRHTAVLALANDSKVSSQIREMLHDGNENVRRAAVMVLANDEEARPNIRQLLEDPDDYVKQEAVRALTNDEEARPAIRQVLRNSTGFAQQAAVNALADDEEVRLDIKALLVDSNLDVSQAAMKALAGHEQTRPIILEMFNQLTPIMRAAAVMELADDEQARPTIRALLRDKYEGVRRAAVQALANDEQARPIIRELLHDIDLRVQYAASSALASDDLPTGTPLEQTRWLRPGLRLLGRDPIPAEPLSTDERLIEEALPRFLKAPRHIHFEREPGLANAILSWLIVRLGKSIPFGPDGFDDTSGRLYGYLDKLDGPNGAQIYVVHVAMHAWTLSIDRDLYALHNTLEAWRVARYLHTSGRVWLILACAGISGKEMKEAVRSLPAMVPGQVLIGPIFHGFELPREQVGDVREWPDLLFDSELDRRWEDLDESTQTNLIGFLARVAPDPRTQPWMLVPVAATIGHRLPAALRAAMLDRLPPAVSGAAKLLERARGHAPAPEMPALQMSAPGDSAPVRLRALIDAMRNPREPADAVAALEGSVDLLHSAPEDALVDALDAINVLWDRIDAVPLARRILAVTEGLSLSDHPRAQRKQSHLIQSIRLFIQQE